MPPTEGLYSWTQEVRSHFSHLSRPQATVLALYSFCAALIHAVGLSKVAQIACELGQGQANSVRQRLKEWYQSADDKSGNNRRQIEPSLCFGPLLAWVLKAWPSGRLVLALDATTLDTRLTVLALSVVYQGTAIPVAWKILKGNTPGEWSPHWQRLLQDIAPHVASDWTVLVLTDRGLESAELFRAIVAVGFHPVMRLKAGGSFRPHSWHKFHRLSALLPCQDVRFCYRGELYQRQSARLDVTLLGLWEKDYEDRWLLATDLDAGQAVAAIYAFRSWIEQGFRLIKRSGLAWHRTRITDPERAERHWLVVAVTTLWLVKVGGEVQADSPVETVGSLPRRGLSLFWQGAARIVACLIQGQPLPLGKFLHQPWPQVAHFENTFTKEQFEPIKNLPL
jgi:hypothetical protein